MQVCITDEDTKNLPVITYIGKFPYHSETKGIYELLEVCQKIKEDFLLLFVANGKELKKFQEAVKEKGLEDKTLFLNFLPPWKIPSIIKRSTCIVALEREDSPIIEYHSSNLVKEVIATGKCLILSEVLHRKETYLIDGQSVLVVNPKNIDQIKDTLETLIKHSDKAERIGQEARKVSERIENFDEYVNRTIQLYERIVV